jgi:hypothetical protein
VRNASSVEHRLDLRVCGKSSFARGLWAARDARKLLRRRVIFAALEPCVDFEGDLGKLLLGFLRPGFDRCIVARGDLQTQLRRSAGLDDCPVRSRFSRSR